jgi:hypothetical protein
MRKHVLVAAALVIGVPLTAMVAHAAIPSAKNKKAYACHATAGSSKGILRVIDYESGERCDPGEAQISWQTQGLRFRGAWKPSLYYASDDVVSYGRAGEAYVAVKASTNERPRLRSTKWARLAGGGLDTVGIATRAWWADPTRPFEVALPSFAGDVAFDGARIWMSGGNSVIKLDPETGDVIAQVPLTAPTAIAFDGSNMWVSTVGDGLTTQDSLVEIDPATNSIKSTIPIGFDHTPREIVYDGTYLWLSAHLSSRLIKFDVASKSVITQLVVADQPSAMVFDGQSIWVAGEGAETVQKVNPSTNQVIDALNVYADGLAYDGRFIWAAVEGDVLKIDPATNSVVATVAAGDHRGGIRFDGRHIWVWNRTNRTVSKIDAGSASEVAQVPVAGQYFGGLEFDGANLWVSGGNIVTKIRV